MKSFIYIFLFVLLLFNEPTLFSNCLIELKVLNEKNIYPGSRIMLKPINNYPLTENIEIYINDSINIKAFELKDKILSFFIPTFLNEGTHKLYIKEKLYEDCAELEINLLKRPEKPDTLNQYDPDPKTNLGKEVDYSKNKKKVSNYSKVKNRSGGSTNEKIEDCDKFHVIDGVFTDSVGYGATKEWSTITPLIGTFSNLYLDYCPKTRILYIMNDWKLGNGNYDSLTCYNEFDFSTAGGAENWKIRIYNSFTKGIIVTLNGRDVSKDTNVIVAGRFGYDKSLLVDSNHTMWEFGVKANGGLFIMRRYVDEVGVVEVKPTVQLVCDEDGYGTIPEPNIITGFLDNQGSELRISDRYIPLHGVAGLVTEPYSFGGQLRKDTAVIYSSRDIKKIINVCKNNHVIDGKFTNEPGAENEWMGTEPARGMFSNLYAEYCNGKLFILNDWKLGYEEPDKQNCYNLFELFTGNGKEHWGIYVFHDNTKKPLVFLNGVDVTSDTSIVEDGKYGFGKSPEADFEHTIYEFAINASEGDWHLFLCDPGPSSFCDSDPNLPRKFSETLKFQCKTCEVANNEISAYYNDTAKFSINYDDLDFLYGNKFKFKIRYDNKLFYPLIENIYTSNVSRFDSFRIEKFNDGLIEIEGFSNRKLFTSPDLISLEGLILAGPSKKLVLSGNLLLGNKVRYMREFDIQPIEINTESKCHLTNNLVFDNTFNILSLYPNPIDDMLFFEIMAQYDAKLSFEILNYRGETQYSFDDNFVPKGINNFKFDVSDLPSGLYLLKISDGLNCNYRKFIKR